MELTEPQVSMRIVYSDEHLIEVETSVSIRGWKAIARAYTSAAWLADEAKRLAAWSYHTEQPTLLEVGDVSDGQAVLRFCRLDCAGHLACYVQLADRNTGPLPETWRIAIEMRTEPALVERFASELDTIANERQGEAVLAGIVN